ncbi:MAG: NAD-dependent epimerase/dehydratase family protein [Ruminococcus sp.]|nr:NAD-dependent epimerase/dehydratase family protein [Ruminococcus sp.]
MNILVIGGTRFFGIHMVEALLSMGHEVTVATRGKAADSFAERIKRIKVDRTDIESMKRAFDGHRYDVVFDNIAYSSNDIKSAMETVDFDKYIYMSTTAVYEPKHADTKETDFDALHRKLEWCNRNDYPYEVTKRQAECALLQKYAHKDWIAVRYPFVIGKDDYTQRLKFYIEHTMKGMPMHIDNVDAQMGFIRSDEAGKFLAFLTDKEFCGAVNGSSGGTISLQEILAYVEKATGKKAVLDENGEEAPYNGEPAYSINTEKARRLGFAFSELHDWIYELVDHYIEEVGTE